MTIRWSRSDLLRKLSLGEDRFFGVKEVRLAGGTVCGPSKDDMADELAAFANTKGGVLLLGVEAGTLEVRGIPRAALDAVEALVRQACEDSVKPPLAAIIERITLPASNGAEVPILRVDVEPSLMVHVSPSGYMHRAGSSKRPMPTDQLGRLLQQRSQSRLVRFDETPVPQAVLGDLDEALWRRFVPESSTDLPEVLLSKLAMAGADHAGDLRPTVAGLLLGSRQPESRMSTAFVQAVAYAGTAVVPVGGAAYQRDAADLTGPLDRQIVGACDFVRRNMKVAAWKRAEGGRVDLPQYDLLAVFEAVTNAVAHRDYSMHGSKVRIRLFDDRLEIYTPGALANTMTPDTLAFRQAARNEAITSLLARCPIPSELATPAFALSRTRIMDKRGEGVPVIIERSRKLSGKTPEYRMVDDSELLLTIYAATPADAPGGGGA